MHTSVEVKPDLYLGNDGYTDYVSLDIPNFFVEQEKVFYQIGKDRKKDFSFVRTWRMLNLKLPAKTSTSDRTKQRVVF